MADYILWGTINQTAPAEFIAVASAVPEVPAEGKMVKTDFSVSYDGAQLKLRRLLISLGTEIRARGGRVVNVETTG